jgi:glycosyltransferase A (GT-A) superfamily protein (DUF2064 family)
MAIVTGSCGTLGVTERPVRILRWTFRRDDDAIVCELGLTGDHTAYQLCIDPPWNPLGVTSELFDDAMSAFQRHAAIERVLVDGGWMLEGFEAATWRGDC